MRRLVRPAALALLLAGCSVGTEGAPCAGDESCPEGQACEYGGRCSKAAAACGTICRQDACGAAGAQACVPDAGRVCAALASPVACSGPAACGVVDGTAECFRLAITSPTTGPLVGASGIAVQATATFDAGGFRAPAALHLMAGSAVVGSVAYQGLSGQVASYAGTYLPPAGLEAAVALRAGAGTPMVMSPAQTVTVDTKPPAISGAAASCPQSPCLRDDVLTVTAAVTDPHLKSAKVSVSMDGHALSGQLLAGSVQLALSAWPFQSPNLADSLTARVTAEDDLGNVATQDVPVAGGLTRVRPPFDTSTGKPVTSPALDAAGTAVCGVADTAGQLRGFKADGTAAWTPTDLFVPGSAGMSVLAAPSIGAVDLFVGSEDGRIYRVLPTGAIPASTPRWPSSLDLVAFPPASLATPVIVTVTGVDHAYSAGGWGRLHQFYSNETVVSLLLPDPVQAAGAISGGTPFVITSTGTAATLRRFTDVAGAPAPVDALPLTDGGAPPVACDKVTVPLAVDGPGNVIAACDNGQIHRVTTGAPLGDQLIFQLPAGVKPTGSPIVARDGAILLPASDGNLRKLTPGAAAATLAWATSIAASPGEVATGVAVMSPVAAISGADLVVTTSQGRVVALDLTGTVRWGGALPGAPGALGFPAIAPAPAGSPSALPTLVAGSAAGKLLRVVVDGGLDAAAPWPKAHHDLRNTGNHAAALP